MKDQSSMKDQSRMTSSTVMALAISLVLIASITMSFVVSRVAQAAPDRAPFPPEIAPHPDSASRTEEPPEEDDAQKASWLDYLKSARLGLGYVAKEFCSCAFVMEREDSFCKAYAALNAIDAKIWSDRYKKEVTATYFFFIQRKAVWNSQSGCQLTD